MFYFLFYLQGFHRKILCYVHCYIRRKVDTQILEQREEASELRRGTLKWRRWSTTPCTASKPSPASSASWSMLSCLLCTNYNFSLHKLSYFEIKWSKLNIIWRYFLWFCYMILVTTLQNNSCLVLGKQAVRSIFLPVSLGLTKYWPIKQHTINTPTALCAMTVYLATAPRYPSQGPTCGTIYQCYNVHWIELRVTHRCNINVHLSSVQYIKSIVILLFICNLDSKNKNI